MRVKALADFTGIGGRKHKAGEVFEVTAERGAELIRQGKAEERKAIESAPEERYEPGEEDEADEGE
jgi:hypothetical protein